MFRSVKLTIPLPSWSRGSRLPLPFLGLKFAKGPNAAAFGAYLDASLREHYDKDGDATGALMRQLDAAIDAGQVSAALNAFNPGAAYASLPAESIQRALALGARLDSRLDELAGVGAAESVFSAGALVSMQGVHPQMMIPGSAGDDRKWTAWTAGYSNRSSVSSDPDHGFGRSTSSDSGATLGVERVFGNMRIGVLTSFGQSQSSTEEPSVQVTGEHWTVGGYGTISIGAITLDASVLWGRGEEKSTRGMAHAKFDTESNQFGLGVAVNMLPRNSRWQVTPVARLKYLGYSQEAFDEVGSGLLFHTDKVTESSVISKLGLRVGHQSELSKNTVLGMDCGAYWVHDFDASAKLVNLRIMGSSGSFQALGRKTPAESAQLNLGLQTTFSETVTVRLSGQQDFGGSRSQSSGVFSIGVNF